MAKKSWMRAIKGGCRGVLSSERGCLGVELSMREGLLEIIMRDSGWVKYSIEFPLLGSKKRAGNRLAPLLQIL
jgi:hypothetical protein